jgi:hypothetical protein
MVVTSQGTTIGTVGSPWRATVTARGAVVPGDGAPVLDWWIAADDRWHDPAVEVSVRQRAIEGAPVLETSLRVPGGDAVHRVYVASLASVPGGAAVVVEVENSSSLPFAVAFARGSQLLTARPPTTVPIEGITLPPDVVVLPVAHGSSVRVALACGGGSAGVVPAGVPTPVQVARGWVAHVERDLRLVLPDDELRQLVVGGRAALVLDGPADPEQDPVGFLLGVVETCRMGEAAGPWVDDVAAAAVAVAKGERSGASVPWASSAALAGAAEVLERAGERKGCADVLAMRRRLGAVSSSPVLDVAALAELDPPRRIAAVLSALVATDGPGDVAVLPGFPAAGLGRSVEAYGLPGPGGRRISVAVRWHGERPALLWEVTGTGGLTVRSPRLDPTWKVTDAKGEALLAPPPDDLVMARS